MKRSIFVITMFPEIFNSFKETGVVGKALRNERSIIEFHFETILLSDFSPKGFKGVDSSSYGGGPGMVMRADVLKKAYDYVATKSSKFKTIYLSPHGERWNNVKAKKMAIEFSKDMDLLFICGRYEGIDQRFIDLYVEQEICLGDFVLSCGDWALLSVLDSMMRFIDGVVRVKESVLNDSFEDGLLDHPHYTKPALFENSQVPSVLLSGNHKNIELWRKDKKIELTKLKRNDLFKQYLKNKKEKV